MVDTFPNDLDVFGIVPGTTMYGIIGCKRSGKTGTIKDSCADLELSVSKNKATKLYYGHIDPKLAAQAHMRAESKGVAQNLRLGVYRTRTTILALRVLCVPNMPVPEGLLPYLHRFGCDPQTFAADAQQQQKFLRGFVASPMCVPGIKQTILRRVRGLLVERVCQRGNLTRTFHVVNTDKRPLFRCVRVSALPPLDSPPAKSSSAALSPPSPVRPTTSTTEAKETQLVDG